jgi:hypothetical protein
MRSKKKEHTGKKLKRKGLSKIEEIYYLSLEKREALKMKSRVLNWKNLLGKKDRELKKTEDKKNLENNKGN